MVMGHALSVWENNSLVKLLRRQKEQLIHLIIQVVLLLCLMILCVMGVMEVAHLVAADAARETFHSTQLFQYERVKWF